MRMSPPIALALIGAAALARFVAGGAPPADESIVVVIHVDALPPSTAAGRDLLKRYAEAARKDPGATRVEVFEELARPNHSTIVATWASRRAYDDHLAADHTRAFRAELQPMLGSPFDERLHRQPR